jgi:circadian clock protein KaiC
MAKSVSEVKKPKGLAKCLTGIRGLDDITEGGLPRGRPTLLCGGPGCGKTLLAMEFIVRGARDYGEPGVFMTFEESTDDLAKNVASLGFDLPGLVRQKKLALDYVHVERSEIAETGEYDLEGLFIRLGSMIDEVGAKRVALDTLESLFAGLPNEGILRAELRRLFRWLKQKRVTAVITAEQGHDNTLTRHGLEEYVSDCVIVLDNRVVNQISTRRLRVVKYRGSKHGTNEYPTMIDEHGLSVLPISSLGLTYPVSRERISSGIPRLDNMLSGKGYYRGTSILVSGTAGTGKSSIATAFADSVCKRGGKVLYCSFEESPDQIIRNMSSIGFHLERHVNKGLLQFHSVRPSLYGLENHLVGIHALTKRFKPEVVVMDPVTNLTTIGDSDEIKAMLTRVIDFFKSAGITALFTSLTQGGSAYEQSEVGISSLMDSWLLLRMIESASERNRLLYVLKSRGMAHSNQMREFVLSDKGIKLTDVYVGPGGVYTGAARLVQEMHDKAESQTAKQVAERRRRELEHELLTLDGQVQALQSKRSGAQQELARANDLEKRRVATLARQCGAMARQRKAD